MEDLTRDLSAVARLHRRRARALEEAEDARDEMIRKAIEAKMQVRDIVAATGLSRERIYQIRNHTR